MKKIYLLFPSFKNVGGVHNVIIDLYKNLKDEFDIIVSSYNMYSEINPQYRDAIPESDYKQISLLKLLFKNVLIISHHRKLTTKLLLLSFFLKKNIIHVAHSEFSNLKHLTLYPQNIVAVSDSVKKNLINFFKQKPSNVTVIRNAINDRYSSDFAKYQYNKNEIVILFPAQITQNKNQVNIVNILKNKLGENVQILFAGDGPLYDELVKACKNNDKCIPLGFRSDMLNLYAGADYVMLFSEKEGLPISLIEAAMMGKPIICNDVGGNLEIVEDKVNGFVCNSFSELIECINYLQNITEEDYKQMSINVREKYLKEFTIDKMIKQYKEIILNFLPSVARRANRKL